jgi:hypothetical protein
VKTRRAALATSLLATRCSREAPGQNGRVLLVGIDGATFRVIEPQMTEARLPHLRQPSRRMRAERFASVFRSGHRASGTRSPRAEAPPYGVPTPLSFGMSTQSRDVGFSAK